MKNWAIFFALMVSTSFALQTIRHGHHSFVPYITADTIHARIQEMGAQISKEYLGREPIFIGVLKGSFIFLADLIRHISIDCEVDFVKISSYGHGTYTSGSVKLLSTLSCTLENRDVIIVEDILDSGLSMKYVVELLQEMKPRSITIAVLLKKDIPGQLDVPAKYVGFNIPPEFVIGYGLDLAEKYRNLPDIYKAEK